MSETSSLGPQHSGDDPLTARMRLHQSWYRADVLGVACGTGPRSSSKSHYGNMLAAEAARAGANFLTPQIHAYARRRIDAGTGAVEPFRLLHNMLSSQPMCFNLFAPLALDLELATRLVRALAVESVATVTNVHIEFAPAPKDEYLDDNTAFDAFIEYATTEGTLGFIGIETKLTEPFSPKHVDKPTYRRWMTSDAPWRDDATEEVDHVVHNQLWRDHLLAWSMLRHPRSAYVEGSLWVVYHPEDRRCTEILDAYRRLLEDDSTVRAVTLAEIVEAWQPHVGPGSWLDDFRTRYLDLDRSEHLWAPPKARSASTKPPVRSGHLRALEQLEDTDAYNRTRTLYRDALEGIEVYLRPANAGLTVLSLDAEHCDSMVGVGRRDTQDHVIRQLPPEPDHARRACAGYLAKRDSLRRNSAEERYALQLIDAALGDGLRMAPEGTYFMAQEWRLPSGARIDILAVDPAERTLVVLELKDSETAARRPDAKKGGHAWQQAEAYATELFEHRDLLFPFFERLGRALARAHGGPEGMLGLELDFQRRPLHRVTWPGAPQGLVSKV